jgi:transcriptional regulator with XRE-family HTH domain/tetratricopeptide (TPR) repeat protein
VGPARTYIPNLRLQWHRHRLRLTQEQVAERVALVAWERSAVRVGVDARMVSKWERGEKRPSRLYQECLRLLFDDPELFGAGDDEVNRRQWLRGTAAVGTAMLLEPAGALPEENGGRSEDGTVGQMLADATAESVELSRQTEASDLGPATLEHLDLAVERLGLVYLNTPPGLLLGELGWYRRRAVDVLGGRHTLAQRRRLYVAAGWLTGLLGHLSFDLGDYQAARAHCVTAWQLADDAGERELGAWVRSIQAMVALYTRRFREAVRYAEAGGELAAAGRTGGVQLPVLAARAHARLGNRRETDLAIRQAEQAFEGLEVSGPPESVFSVDEARVPFCAGTAYVWLDPQRAAAYSRKAISLYDAATGTGRWPANRALARLDLATALTHLGEPEEASHTALEAIAIFAERPVDSVIRRAGDLEAVLDAEPYRQLRAVRQFREQLQTTRTEAGLA